MWTTAIHSHLSLGKRRSYNSDRVMMTPFVNSKRKLKSSRALHVDHNNPVAGRSLQKRPADKAGVFVSAGAFSWNQIVTSIKVTTERVSLISRCIVIRDIRDSHSPGLLARWKLLYRPGRERILMHEWINPFLKLHNPRFPVYSLAWCWGSDISLKVILIVHNDHKYNIGQSQSNRYEQLIKILIPLFSIFLMKISNPINHTDREKQVQ